MITSGWEPARDGGSLSSRLQGTKCCPATYDLGNVFFPSSAWDEIAALSNTLIAILGDYEADHPVKPFQDSWTKNWEIIRVRLWPLSL